MNKFANAESQRARQLPIEVNRTATHAGDYTRVLRFGAAEANQNNVAFRSIGVSENTKYFHVHRFRLDALKDGVRHALHSGVDLAYRDGWNWFGIFSVCGQRGYKKAEYTPKNDSSHEFVPEDRQQVRHQKVTLRALYCQVGGVKADAKQNIPIAKFCVYTSTAFPEEFHVFHCLPA